MRAAAQPLTSATTDAALSSGTVRTERATTTSAVARPSRSTATETRTLRCRRRDRRRREDAIGIISSRRARHPPDTLVRAAAPTTVRAPPSAATRLRTMRWSASSASDAHPGERVAEVATGRQRADDRARLGQHEPVDRLVRPAGTRGAAAPCGTSSGRARRGWPPPGRARRPGPSVMRGAVRSRPRVTGRTSQPADQADDGPAGDDAGRGQPHPAAGLVLLVLRVLWSWPG